jgi:hypothetical protein
MDELSPFRTESSHVLDDAGWTKCSFEARIAKAPGSGVNDDAISIEFLVNSIWTAPVDLLSANAIWTEGSSKYRVYQFQGMPSKIRITSGPAVDRYSINKVRLTAHTGILFL